MQAPSTLPYSGKSLKALQEVLRVHQSFVWHNPATSSMEVKRLAPARGQYRTQQEA